MTDNKCIVCQSKIPLEEGNLCTQCEEKGDFEVPRIIDNLNCGTCNLLVEEDCEGLVCDMCSNWYHNCCNKVPLKRSLYSLLNDAPKNVKWFCDKCIWETEKRLQLFKDDKESGGMYDRKAEYDPLYKAKEPEIKLEIEDDCDMSFDYSGSNFSDYEDEIKNIKNKRKVKEKPYKCKQCNHSFAHRNSLKKHIDNLNHHGTESYQCQYCEECFSNRGSLKTHLQTHPENNLGNESEDISDDFDDRHSTDSEDYKETKRDKKKKKTGNKYQCCKCERKFSYKSPFEKHIETCDHNGVKSYQCTHCEKTFSSKIERIKHQKAHSENKILQCSHCGKVFRRQDHLKMHELMHTGEKPHQCDYCGKFFARKDNMVIHARTHTGEKPYECGYCGKVFAKQSNFKTHERIHTGEKPYQCNQCEKGFTNKSNLTTHLKTHTEKKSFQRKSAITDLPIFTKRKSTLPVSKSLTASQHKSSITTLPIFTKSKATLPTSMTAMSSPTKISQSVHNTPMLSTTVTHQQSRPIINSSPNPITPSHQMSIQIMADETFSYPTMSMPPLQNSAVSSQLIQPEIQNSAMSPQNASFRDLCNTPTSSSYSDESPLSLGQPLNSDSMQSSYMSSHILPSSVAESYQYTILNGKH